MTTVKTVAVLAIVVGCFGVLYPKIFHPMLVHIFTGASKGDSNDPNCKYPCQCIVQIRVILTERNLLT